MPSCRRVNIKAILAEQKLRTELLVRSVYAIQKREDPTMTMERARAAVERWTVKAVTLGES
jgi:hypothetical protein